MPYAETRQFDPLAIPIVDISPLRNGGGSAAHEVDPDTQVDARDIYGVNYEPQQPAISCGDYLIWCFGKAFAY